MTEPILTIGIPTYNRLKNIQKTVRTLLPQLNDRVKLVVHDNCSDTPVSELFTDEEKEKFSIIRNKVNIGGDANIVGCIYHANTKWVWTLGDDDTPATNAVRTILKYIEEYPEELYFKFGSKIERETETLEDLAKLCRTRNFYPNLLFISNTIYNRDKIKDDLFYYYQNLSFMNGQVVFLLKHLIKRNDKCLFLRNVIIEDHGLGDGWDYDMMIKRSINMFNLFPEHKKIFSKTIYVGMAFQYYRGILFSEKLNAMKKWKLFIYVIRRVGIINTIIYNHSIIGEFLLSKIVPRSLYEKLKTIKKHKYYKELNA